MPWLGIEGAASAIMSNLRALIGPVYCKQRERLIKLHLAAVAKNAEAGETLAESRGKGWREAWLEATREARRACRETLADLNRHRAEHGC
jgi:hypothetical protein